MPVWRMMAAERQKWPTCTGCVQNGKKNVQKHYAWVKIYLTRSTHKGVISVL
jgi:hypothetical protein